MLIEVLPRLDDEDALAIFKDLAEQDAILIDDGGRPDIVLMPHNRPKWSRSQEMRTKLI